MIMITDYLYTWQLFIILFALLLIVSFIMKRLSKNFYTKDVIERKFSIMELTVPASYIERNNVLTGIYKIEDEYKRKQVMKSLKSHLWLDFLFMPLAYGCIFLLCLRVATKMELRAGYMVFLAFGLAQIIPWIIDIYENLFLLGKLNKLKDSTSQQVKDSKEVMETKRKKHSIYLFAEAVKWAIVLTALTISVSAISYFWLTGQYSIESSKYILYTIVALILFVLLEKFTNKNTAAT